MVVSVFTPNSAEVFFFPYTVLDTGYSNLSDQSHPENSAVAPNLIPMFIILMVFYLSVILWWFPGKVDPFHPYFALSKFLIP